MAGFIFDEKYYVNASRVVAGVPMSSIDTYANASPAGTDPNGEHPQLGKVIIAATIRLFGDPESRAFQSGCEPLVRPSRPPHG